MKLSARNLKKELFSLYTMSSLDHEFFLFRSLAIIEPLLFLACY